MCAFCHLDGEKINGSIEGKIGGWRIIFGWVATVLGLHSPPRMVEMKSPERSGDELEGRKMDQMAQNLVA